MDVADMRPLIEPWDQKCTVHRSVTSYEVACYRLAAVVCHGQLDSRLSSLNVHVIHREVFYKFIWDYWVCACIYLAKIIFTTFAKIFYSWPPLWSSGQSSWLQIRRPGFDSRHYQKKKVLGLERGPLSLVSTTEELLDRKVAAPV
jgi:hypothetical protein